MRTWRALALALTVLAGAYWLALPDLPAAPLGTPLPAAARLNAGQATGPIAHAYRGRCLEGGTGTRCRAWHLVAADGRRWWLPDGSDRGDALALGRQLVAHLLTDRDQVTVMDVRTGATRSFPCRGACSSISMSRDDRHVAVEVEKGLVIHETATGRVTGTATEGTPAGWTDAGLALTRTRPSDTAPGHLSSAELVEISPAGTTLTRRPIPANLANGPAVSPDGRTLAVASPSGVSLVDAATGEVTRTLAVPAAERVLGWRDGGHVLVATARPPGGFGSLTAYHVLDVAGGGLRPLTADDRDADEGTFVLGVSD
ncbi:hypothetical protein HII36_10450 [Nonomuraea sp. NN258]|uniref:hypothetical protein n=1 Tax=Nonomuraea antri TaxID=2730852 RepID=UPI001569BDB6|nr:hypothetical protein [Nonomuraea antri]NRQ32253.1 hypothetical protein [Nonomuraea antri]